MDTSNCRFFSGYSPCKKNSMCNTTCPSYDPIEQAILFVHLGALGSVVRSTALLPAIKRKHPRSRLVWLTEDPGVELLKTHPLVDQVVSYKMENLIQLLSTNWDVAYVLDKSLKATAVASFLEVEMVRGFKAHPKNGGVVPATPDAEELWQIGLDNEKKFFKNKKTELQLCHEALDLDEYLREPYKLFLTDHEIELSKQRQQIWALEKNQPVIGFNTGCSPAIPYKKWTIEYHRSLIQKLQKQGYKNIVLLGGEAEGERNWKIAKDLQVSLSPTDLGLRDGLVSIEACDIIISGDSLGMHLGIAQKKYVIAWFGPTCAHEIDLFDRGEKILSAATCGPCWKRTCQKEVMCYDLVDQNKIISAVEKESRKQNVMISSLTRHTIIQEIL